VPQQRNRHNNRNNQNNHTAYNSRNVTPKRTQKRTEKRKKAKKKAFFAGILAVGMIAGGSVFAYGQYMKSKMEEAVNVNTIYSGISINGTDVSGKTKEEALQQLQQEADVHLGNQKITIQQEDKIWDIPFSDLDVKYDIEASVEQAWEIGRTGELKDRYKVVTDVAQNKEDIPISYTHDKQKVVEKLQEIATEFNVEAQDSTITRKNGAFQITEEQKGYAMDVDKTVPKVEEMLEQNTGGTIEPEITITEPKVTKADNEKVTDLIGTYSTTYSANAAGRNENLRVGCANIDGTVIAPGEVFSMNVGLGPQTYANGYKDAGVYVNGKVEQGVAGGVCQVTSTLYNAVILAELEVVERYPHSMTVGYVPLGRDAAVAGDYKDLKFRNDTEYPVYLEAYARDGKVVCNLYGHEIHDAGHKVDFEMVFDGTIPKPAEKVTQDATKPEGYRQVTYTGKTGSKVSTYKIITENGKQISKEWFSSSTYRATADEVTVGTKKAEVAPTPAPETTPTETPETNEQTTDTSTTTENTNSEQQGEVDSTPIGAE
jgi:vancomycin resistance protein YoaR